jgi:hypothetical protein
MSPDTPPLSLREDGMAKKSLKNPGLQCSNLLLKLSASADVPDSAQPERSYNLSSGEYSSHSDLECRPVRLGI